MDGHELSHAQVRAQRIGAAAVVMTRGSQASGGYGEGVRDSLADLARIQMDRRSDEVSHKDCGVGSQGGYLFPLEPRTEEITQYYVFLSVYLALSLSRI